MKRRSEIVSSMLAAMLGLAFSVPAFAQDSPMSASQSMNKAGESMEAAGSNTAAAAKHAYNGIKTAATDTKITAKVKTAIHMNKIVDDGNIAVSTVAGVVTLKGQVPSPDVAAQAEQVAKSTEGVKAVNNELTVVNMSATSK